MTNLYHHPDGHVFYRKLGHGRPKISHADGIYLYDVDGKRYIDGSGGPFVINVGHGRKEITEAIRKQAQDVAYVHATMFTSEVIEQYADELAKIMPFPDPRLYFVTTGSEATEAAIKLARQIQMARGEDKRSHIISRHQSYHGMSLGALSISGRQGLRKPYEGMMPYAIYVSPPYPYRDERSGQMFAEELEEVIIAHGSDTIAAFIAEPISGAGLGACIPPDDYWPSIHQVCHKYGILLIVDEVFTGMGRTGKWWGINHWDIQPDILITSKGIAGGYFPLGCVVTSRDNVDLIMNKLGDFNHGGTFSHHLVGAAAGLATLDILNDENLVDKCAREGKVLGDSLKNFLGNHPNIGDIRGIGLHWTIEVVADRETKSPFPSTDKVAPRIWQAAFDLGLSVYYSQGCADGINGDLILIGPPFTINADQIQELTHILYQAFNVVLPQK